MMRLSNCPMAVAILLLCVGSAVVGFPAMLPWAGGVYLASLFAYHLVKRAVMRRVGYFDNAWHLSQGLSMILAPAAAEGVTLAMGLVGWGAPLGSLYLALRLWLWSPDELPVFGGVPLLGSLVTVAAAWVLPSVLQPALDAILYSHRRPA